MLKKYEYIPINVSVQESIETIDAYITEKKRQGYEVYIADESSAAYTIPLNEYKKNWDMLLVGNIGSATVQDMLKTEMPSIYILRHDESTLGKQAHFELIGYIKENYVFLMRCSILMFTKKITNKISVSYMHLFLLSAVFAVILLLFCEGISGNDFWWHVKVGEYICENHAVPTTDIFSWVGMSYGIYWTAHEWLADVIFYSIFCLAGETGIFVFSLLCALFMTLLLWKNSRNYIEQNFLISGLFFLLFAILTSLFFYGRPHIFSYFFLFSELKILYRFSENADYKGIYFLPVISVIWSNIHGGSSNLTYILCIVFLLTGLFEFEFGKIKNTRYSKKAILILSGVTIGTIMGIFINPVGIQVFLYPYQSFADTLSMSVISEWHAPDAKKAAELILFFFPILIMSIGLISELKKIRFIDLIIMCIFLLLFFRSARFIVLWYIAASFYAFPYIPPCRIKEMKKKYEAVTLLLIIAIMLISSALSIGNIVIMAKDENLISDAMSKETVEFIKSDDPQRIFNDYNVGETLIYNDIQVFFDARADLYRQEHILEDGISLLFLQQVNSESEITYVNVDELIHKYDFDAILVLKSRPLYSYLISHPDKYIGYYEDDTVGYFRITSG